MNRVILFAFVASCLALRPVSAAEKPRWIWADSGRNRTKAVDFTRRFNTREKPAAAHLSGIADFCEITLFINGRRIANVEDYSPKFRFDVTETVRKGRNVIAAQATSAAGPATVAMTLTLTFRDGTTQTIVTDDQWRWKKPKARTRKTAAVKTLGIVADEPFGEHPDSVTIRAADDYTQWKQALGTKSGTDPTGFFTRPGFQIELLRSAKPNEGSWVGLAFDSKGRLVIAREDKGLLRVTFGGKHRRPVRVETINDTLKECRGLLFAHGALYAHANNSLGLYRLRDTNGDDKFDEVKLLRKTAGGKGHGRNDLALGPDGMIYAIHGDSVEIPRDVRDRFPALDRHTRKGRRGFVMRTDADGKRWEVVVSGMRNPFGIDFNADGEMFTYDADAEYDMGSSWYRPTRILHMQPGADYGWRAVTRAWPAYDPDTAEAAPPALDIGKGSPTGVRFGTKSNFPPKYKQALYALDWAYGRVLAVHMTPRGGGYAMRAETFLKGRPFNVTNLDFGPDGAMYLVTGGRKTKSGLYRVTFTGKRPAPMSLTPQQRARVVYSKTSRAMRQKLESRIGRRDDATLDLAWTHLNSPDSFLRYAARRVVEHMPLKMWRSRALKEKQPRAAFTALLSLAQAGDESTRSAAVERLLTLSLKSQPVSLQLTALRVFQIALQRAGESSSTLRPAILKRVDPLFPAKSWLVNQRLATLLVDLQAPDTVGRIMSLYLQAKSQRERFHYLYELRRVKTGWEESSRNRYFRSIGRMSRFLGGQGMPTFIRKIGTDALAGLKPAERKRMQQRLSTNSAAIVLPAAAKNRRFVRAWKPADLADALNQVRTKRNYTRGRLMFHAAACSACHRVQRDGVLVGPDLTSVGRRFTPRDILNSILDPSKVVAEQYRLDTLVTKRGKTITGHILHRGDYRSDTIEILTDPLKPDSLVKIKKGDVEFQRKSKTSMMPKGLLDTLSKQEILDLLAYLTAGGNKNHPAFKN